MAAGKKRKLSPILKAWRECWKSEGICPMFGVTPAQKAQVRACVKRKTGR